jgi:hypothetical protein
MMGRAASFSMTEPVAVPNMYPAMPVTAANNIAANDLTMMVLLP